MNKQNSLLHPDLIPLNIHPIETQLSHILDFRVLRMFHPDFHRPWTNLYSYSNALGPQSHQRLISFAFLMVVVILTWEIRDIRVALISFPSWIKMLTIFHMFIIHSFFFFEKGCSVGSILLTGLIPLFINFLGFIMCSRLLSPCQMNGWEGFLSLSRQSLHHGWYLLSCAEAFRSQRPHSSSLAIFSQLLGSISQSPSDWRL